MRLITLVVISSLVLLIWKHDCPGQDAQQRFASFLLEKAVVDDGFSVLIEKSEIGDTIDEVGNPSIESARIYQRLIVSNGGRTQRLDGKYSNLLRENAIENRSTEAQLVLFDRNKSLQYSKDWIGTKVLTEELKGGLVMIRTRTVRKHPFDLAVTNAVGFATERSSGIVYSSPRLLEESVLKDGRTKMFLLVGQNGAWEVTFQKEPEWCPQEIVFYARRGKPVPKSGVTLNELKSWDKYATSRCTWTHDELSDYWVPSIINLTTTEDGNEREMEVRCLDWKFGRDAVAELTDEEYFVPEKITKSIDFEKIRERFDRTSSR